LDWVQINLFPDLLAFSEGQIIIDLSFFYIMSYLLCTKIDNKNFCVVTNVEAKKFELIEVKSESSLSRTWCTPHKSEAMNILRWDQ